MRVLLQWLLCYDRSKNEYDGGISCFENYTQKEMSSVANPNNNKNNIRRNNNNNINDIT